MKERVIKLRAEDTKDYEARIIPICVPLHKILMDIPRAIHVNHVFLYRGKPMTDIRAGLSGACKKAGITFTVGLKMAALSTTICDIAL